jgi:hypothetical protein
MRWVMLSYLTAQSEEKLVKHLGAVAPTLWLTWGIAVSFFSFVATYGIPHFNHEVNSNSALVQPAFMSSIKPFAFVTKCLLQFLFKCHENAYPLHLNLSTGTAPKHAVAIHHSIKCRYSVPDPLQNLEDPSFILNVHKSAQKGNANALANTDCCKWQLLRQRLFWNLRSECVYLVLHATNRTIC